MIVAAIGYPIGFYDGGYQIELNGNFIKLTEELGAAWLLLNSISEVVEESDEMNKLIHGLERNGVLVSGDTIDEFMSGILSFKTLRQGTGVTMNGEKTILFGEYRVVLKDISFDIWKLSNYRRTLKDIHKLINSKYHCSDEEFSKSFAELYDKSLVFIS